MLFYNVLLRTLLRNRNIELEVANWNIGAKGFYNKFGANIKPSMEKGIDTVRIPKTLVEKLNEGGLVDKSFRFKVFKSKKRERGNNHSENP